MKNKIIKKVKKELELSDSFFDHEIEIIINIVSKVLDKYIKENDKKINLIEFIKKLFYLLRANFINLLFFSNKYSYLRLHQLPIYVNMYLV